MAERVHWRKTAKVCPQCHKLKSAGNFIPELEACHECEFDNELFKLYKRCQRCRKFQPRDNIPNAICHRCLEIEREKNHRFKGSPKLDPKSKHICTICNVSRSSYAYPKGTDPDNPKCRLCITEQRLQKEGKFRCRQCGSSFPLSERGWSKGNGTYFCLRCTKKGREWTNKYCREVYRKRPEVIEFSRQYSRWKYWTKLKPIMNKTLFLQWTHGLAKPRKLSRDRGWWVVNRAMFEDFKKRPAYWFNLTEKVIRAMKSGSEANERLERLARSNFRPPPPMF
jgi:hypothetical protein